MWTSKIAKFLYGVLLIAFLYASFRQKNEAHQPRVPVPEASPDTNVQAASGLAPAEGWPKK